MNEPPERRRTLIMIAAAFIAAGALMLGGYFLTRSHITLYLNGIPYEIYTHLGTVGDVMKVMGVAVGPGDRIDPPPKATLYPGMVITANTARTVYVDWDGELRQISTLQLAPRAILAEAGVALRPGDVLIVDGTPENAAPTGGDLAAPVFIRVRRPASVTLRDGDQVSTIETTAVSAGQFLSEQGVPLYAGDRVSVPLSHRVEPGMEIAITRANRVIIRADGQTHTLYTRAATVADVLDRAGVRLGRYDYARPPLSAPAGPDMRIEIVRVTVEERFSGAQLLRIRYENGVEVNRIGVGYAESP
jgi:uncharacterized protein YabE (DUF348 family)